MPPPAPSPLDRRPASLSPGRRRRFRRTRAPSRILASTISGALVVASVLVTALLLLLSGGLVDAACRAARQAGLPWIEDLRVAQFVNLAAPVALTVAAWKVFDAVRLRLKPRRPN